MITEVRSDAVIKENEFETFTDLKEKIRKMCNGRVVGEDDENNGETGEQRTNGGGGDGGGNGGGGDGDDGGGDDGGGSSDGSDCDECDGSGDNHRDGVDGCVVISKRNDATTVPLVRASTYKY